MNNIAFMENKKIPSIIKDIVIYLTTDYSPRIIGNMIDVNGLATIGLEKDNKISLSFEIRANPTFAAILTKEFFTFMIKKKKYSIDIYEEYALVFDEKTGICSDVLFGDDAIKYMHDLMFYEETDDQDLDIAKKKEDDNHQKKVDGLLDQITSKGLHSLDEIQKQFLIDFSKGKIK
jgi:hypothetical protein